MKRILLIMAVLLGTVAAQAQTAIKGILLDSLSRESEPYATVRLYAGETVLTSAAPVAQALTDDEGKFTLTISKQGRFVLVAAVYGKTPAVRQLSLNGQPTLDLGTLLIAENQEVMKDVEVVAVRPVVKMEADKVTYSVEDDVDSRSMSVLDMLRKVPMVMVDGQDNITVNGQSSFKIYVDGKPNPMLSSNPSIILKAMPASMVSNIEVVTNPGAKYDAEGAGGILNFTLARTGADGAGNVQDGNMYSGALTATGGNRVSGVGATISGQDKKLSYNADVNYYYTDNGTVDMQMDRRQDNGAQTLFTTTAHNRVPIVMGNIGLGYELGKRSNINGQFGLQRFQVTNSGNPSTSLVMPGGINFGYRNRMSMKMANTAYNGMLDFQHFFDEKRLHSLTVTYQVNHTPSDKDNETLDFEFLQAGVPQDFLPTGRLSDGRETTTEHVGQLDLVNGLTAHSKLNTGLKYSFRKSQSDMDYYEVQGDQKVFAPDLSTDYDHRDQIGAVYAESENNWDKWTAKAGLRYEHTWQRVEYLTGNGSTFHKDYGNLVPSATLSYSLLPGSSLGLTYNMRISRPGITYLNPYRDNSEPTSVTYGNKDLEVEKSHNIGLVLNLYTPKVIISSSLRQTLANGGIEQYSFYQDGILNTTFGNIVDRSLTTFNLFASWSAAKNTRVTFNGSVTYNYLTSDQLDLTNKGWSANGMVNIQQTLPKDWTIGVTAIGNTKTLTLQGSNTGANLGVLTVGKSLFNKRLNLSINGVTGFSKGGRLHINQYATGKDFTSNTRISVPLSRVSLTVRWTFGNTNRAFSQHKSKVQDDYIEHQSSTESIGNAGGTTGSGASVNVGM